MIQIDMPMPKNCAECRMVDDEFEYCHGKEVTHKSSDWLKLSSYVDNKTKPDWCPLKEQEAVPYKRDVNEHGQVISCGNCGAWFIVQYQKYCHECGFPVLWEGR